VIPLAPHALPFWTIPHFSGVGQKVP
jgi:hypothetical protein